MLLQPEQKDNSRRLGPRLASVAIHGVVLLILFYRPAALFVSPTFALQGNNGVARSEILLADNWKADMRASLKDTPDKVFAPTNSQAIRLVRPQKHGAIPQLAKKDAPKDSAEKAVKAGTQFGSLYDGSEIGHEIRPAFPIVYPDPAVARAELPAGLQGDVIVEVTIDAQGNITETKVIRALGHGLDEKVLAALQNWRFQPATRDGIAIASQQDVHFHFPG